MYNPSFWSLRQNPCGNTDQIQMRDFIISQNVVTCPFGHLNTYRNNVIDEVYNESEPEWKSLSQDRIFIEKMNIGDIVLIPFKGLRECILARIVSNPIYLVDTGLFTSSLGEKTQVSKEGETPFRPVGRNIQIISNIITFSDKRVIPMLSLSRMNENKLPSHIIALCKEWNPSDPDGTKAEAEKKRKEVESIQKQIAELQARLIPLQM